MPNELGPEDPSTSEFSKHDLSEAPPRAVPEQPLPPLSEAPPRHGADVAPAAEEPLPPISEAPPQAVPEKPLPPLSEAPPRHDQAA